jgi:hypothetical protein
MRSRQVVGWCALSLCLAAWPRPAAAQIVETPAVEISGGVQALHIPGEFYPFGIDIDLSGAASERGHVRWVVEAGMAQDRPVDIGDTLRLYHAGAGVRFTPSARRRATPYFQILGGGAQAIAENRSPIESSWGPMIQPGIGVSVPLTRYIAVYGQGDYRVAFLHPQGDNNFGWDVDNEFRAAFGVRFMLW